MKKICLVLLLTVFCMFLCACTVERVDEKKEKDLEYVIMEPEDVPQELKNIIEEDKADDFEVIYGDQGFLYVAKGYGRQQTGGYHIEVTACYESSNTIYVETEFQGPRRGEEIEEKSTCPYVVIKMADNEKQVVFL